MRYSALAIVTIGMLTLTSCCMQKDCPDELLDNEIEFYNFTENDLQYITVELFVAKADNPEPTFTYDVVAYPSESGDHFVCTLPAKIGSYYDYHVLIGKVQPEAYVITNLTFDCEDCNSCVFSHSTTCTLAGYRVNGKNQEGPSVRIEKGTGL